MAYTVKTLLDAGVKMCGGQSGLGRRLGISQQLVSLMVKGRAAVTPETVGLLCALLDIEGEEASRLALEAIVQGATPEKQGVLRRAFFACAATLGVFGAALWTLPDASAYTVQQVESAAAKNVSTSNEQSGSVYYVNWIRRLTGALRAPRTALRAAWSRVFALAIPPQALLSA